MLRFIIFIIYVLSTCFCYADYSSRGKPWDDPNYHESPLTPIFLVIVVLVLIIIAGTWLVAKIQENKEAISNAIGQIFVLGLILGGIMLVAKCGEELHNSKVSNQSYSTTMPNITTPPKTNQSKPQVQSIQQDYTPTLKYRTVEYYENCFYCNGSGKVVCPKCRGRNSIERICTHCNGSGNYGQSRCIDCQIRGYQKELGLNIGSTQCFSCGGTGYITKTCHHCSGSGKTSEICDYNAFINNEPHDITCSHCNGSGRVRHTRQESYYE